MVDHSPLLELTDAGLFCTAGDFHIDPWMPVRRAVVTHAHADHLCPGHGAVLVSDEGAPLVRYRLEMAGEVGATQVQGAEFGLAMRVGGVTVSLHPAGHIRGSAQVRIERGGEVWVVSGDYKLDADPTATGFELVRCSTLVTESTFALPVFRWPAVDDVVADIRAWWMRASEEGRPAVLYAYSVGKAQRLLALLQESDGPILTHGAVEGMAAVYRDQGVDLARTELLSGVDRRAIAGALILAPPLSQGSPWSRRFAGATSAMASGWMRVRGPRRRRALDRGFVLSDHVDWPALNEVVTATGAERVLITHGFSAAAARWFRERGLDAVELATPYGLDDEGNDEAMPEVSDPAAGDGGVGSEAAGDAGDHAESDLP